MTYTIHYDGIPGNEKIPTRKQAFRRAKFYRDFCKRNQLNVEVTVHKDEETKTTLGEPNMQPKTVQNFVKLYFQAENRADTTGYNQVWQKMFTVKDRYKLAEEVIFLLENKEIERINNLAIALTEHEGGYSSAEERKAFIGRHNGRLKRWVKDYEAGVLKLENAITVKREAKAKAEDCAILKRNLIESAKSICHSALKNNLSEEEVQIIFNSGLITAKEERKVQETKGALQAFLRQNGITKDIAIQILENA